MDILLDQDKQQTTKRTEHDNTDMQTPILPKKAKGKERIITHTLVKPDNDKPDILTGSMTSLHIDNDNQSTIAHDESDSTIIYDYQADIYDIEIKNSSTCNTEIKTKSEETKLTLEPTKNIIETETCSIDQIYSEDNQVTTDPTNNKKGSAFEPQTKSPRNRNVKNVKIVLQKLSTQEIKESSKIQDANLNKEERTNQNVQIETHTHHLTLKEKPVKQRQNSPFPHINCYIKTKEFTFSIVLLGDVRKLLIRSRIGIFTTYIIINQSDTNVPNVQNGSPLPQESKTINIHMRRNVLNVEDVKRIFIFKAD